jgi:hypothetical protein
MNHPFKMLALLAFAGNAIAAPHELLPEQAGDLSAAAAVAPSAAAAPMAALASVQPSHDAVSLSWAARDAVVTPATPFLAQSKETWFTASADELAQGVAVNTTAPRALVRIQALSAVGPREALAIHPQSMTLVDKNGRAYDDGAGMEMLVSADKLAKADVPFAPGTSAFRMHPSLGAGSFKLRVNGASGSDRYLVNVVEPDSPYALTMQSGALHYLHGQQLVLTAALQDGSAGGGTAAPKRGVDKFDATVVSPAGRRFPVSFKAGKDGALRAALSLDADEAPIPGLWEVQAEANTVVKGQAVRRSVRLAFPVAMPVARLTHAVALQAGAGVNLNVGVEAAAAGRYEVRGMLYGTVKGALVPLGVADAAQWMEAGQGQIALSFAPELIAGTSGPFEVRELFLMDQGRLGVLHHQQRALALSEDDVVRAGGREAATTRGLTAGSSNLLAPDSAHVKRAPNPQGG